MTTANKAQLRIRKVDTVDNPLVESAEWDEFDFGIATPKSLPVEYEIEGFLAAPIEEGKPLQVLRTKRNGVEMPGLFTTSYVMSTNEITTPDGGETPLLELRTENSIYLIEIIK